MSKKQDININDGWVNLLSSFNRSGHSKNPATSFGVSKVLTNGTLENIYRDEGFGRRIIDIYAKYMTRAWFDINGDAEGLILDYLKGINAKDKFTQLIKWARLYGGAIIIIGANDGSDYKQWGRPLNENAIRSIDFLHVIDRSYITIPYENFYVDPNNAKFGLPEIYTIHGGFVPTSGGKKAAEIEFDVHESRILRLDGVDLPQRAKLNNQGWGDSFIQAVYNYLRRIGVSYGYTEEILHDFILSVFKIQNLAQLIASDKEAQVIKRAQIMQLCKSINNSLLIDDKEEFEKITSNVGGLTDIINSFLLALSAVTGIPEMILLGKSPSGLTATGDSDIRSWYDSVAGDQTDYLEPLLHRLIDLILKASKTPSDIKDIGKDQWSIDFNPLWQIDDKENADLKFVMAQADNLYMANDVLQSDEVRQSRFGGEIYSQETKLDETLDQDQEPEETEEQEPQQPPPQIGEQENAEPSTSDQT